MYDLSKTNNIYSKAKELLHLHLGINHFASQVVINIYKLSEREATVIKELLNWIKSNFATSTVLYLRRSSDLL